MIGIYNTALTFGGVSRAEYDSRVKNYHASRKALENRLVGARRQIRALMLDRALLQLEDRLIHRCNTPVSQTHKKVIENLLTLATSHYSGVRSRAQDILHKCLSLFGYSYRLITPRLIEIIGNKETKHEAFKGALYVLLGYKNKTLLTKHDWEVRFDKSFFIM